LRSVSDEVVVIQEGTIMRTETLEGRVLGSFSVGPDWKCNNKVEILSDDRLYLSGCKGERIVDLNGKQQLKLRPPKGCCRYYSNRLSANLFPWSANGSRLLFDHTSRRVSVLRNVGENALEVALLGNAGLELRNNRQEVRVVDTVTGASCFDWRRSFPMGDGLHFFRVASVSPSGEFVAMAAEKTLAIYRLPAICQIQH